MNITCDRIRALIMCLTDGIYPGISGRNYYVKLMAKSLLNDIRCKLHLKMPQFLSKFVPVFHEVFSESYGCHMWQTRDQLEWICDRVESDTLRSIQKSCNDNDSIQISQHYEQQSEPKDDNRLLPRTIVSDYPAVVNRLLRHLEARFCDDFHLEIQKCVECCDTKEMWISFCCTPILHSRYNNITATRFLASETGQNSGGESNRRDRIFCKRHLESRCRLTECKFYHCSDATKSRINAELDEIKNLSHNITKTVKDFSEKDRLRSKEQDCRRLVRFSTEKTGTFSYKLRLVLDK
ncbi:MAG: Aars2p [Marteilia pararefringens]